MILGGGPNRIGQGIEFDYCCVHASFALREAGFETIMVNSNPETVSTDYDTSDRLYFEPLTLEDVLNIYRREKCWGVIVQFGGQTPLNLAKALERNGVNIIGTSPGASRRPRTASSSASWSTAWASASRRAAWPRPSRRPRRSPTRIGYPVLVRPSFVLGGRAMVIVYDDDDAAQVHGARPSRSPKSRPVLIDQFLEDAVEVDVDCISDGETSVIGGSWSTSSWPASTPATAPACIPRADAVQRRSRRRSAGTRLPWRASLKVCGLMNVQYAVKDGEVYVLEVNPRASRTVPFVSKAIGVPLAKLAALVHGRVQAEGSGLHRRRSCRATTRSRKPCFPFARFPGVDVRPEPGDEVHRRGHGHRHRRAAWRS